MDVDDKSPHCDCGAGHLTVQGKKYKGAEFLSTQTWDDFSLFSDYAVQQSGDLGKKVGRIRRGVATQVEFP